MAGRLRGVLVCATNSAPLRGWIPKPRRGDVFVEFFKVLLGKEVVTTLDGKNDVDVDLRIGIRHNEMSGTGRS